MIRYYNLLLTILADVRCGINERWYNDHGGCDPTCDAPNKQCEGIIAGCFCLRGYVRNENGICIPQEYCYYKPRSGKYYISEYNKKYKFITSEIL